MNVEPTRAVDSSRDIWELDGDRVSALATGVIAVLLAALILVVYLWAAARSSARAASRHADRETTRADAERDRTTATENELLRYQTTFASIKGRGELGETVLTRTATAVGLRSDVHFTTQTEISGSSSDRPDLVLLLDGNRRVSVDAKCVVAPYWTAVETSDPLERDDSLKKLATTIRSHAKILIDRRYDRSGNDLSGVVLFVPTDAIATAALDADPTLLGFLVSNGVFLVGPTGFAVLAAGARIASADRELRSDLSAMTASVSQALSAADNTVRYFDLANKQLRLANVNLSHGYRHLNALTSALNDLRGMSGRGNPVASPKPVEGLADFTHDAVPIEVTDFEIA